MSRILLVMTAAMAACATAGQEADLPDATGGGGETFIDASSEPSFRAITLSQTTSTTVGMNNSLACGNTDGTTAENSWYRIFRLADSDIASGLVVNSVAFGVQEALGTPEVKIKIGTYSGPIQPPPSQLDASLISPLAEKPYTIPNTYSTAPMLISVPIMVNVPALSQLVVEITAPSYEGRSKYFYLGGNSDGETAPAYLRAPSGLCNSPQPRSVAVLGFPDSHLVLSVSGTYAAP